MMCLKEKLWVCHPIICFKDAGKKVRKKRIKAVFWTFEGTLSQSPQIPSGRHNAYLWLKRILCSFVSLLSFFIFYLSLSLICGQHVAFISVNEMLHSSWGRFQRGIAGRQVREAAWLSKPGHRAACDLVQSHPCLGPGFLFCNMRAQSR